MQNQLSLIPLGGVGDVTKNMYIYEYADQILIVDCGLGFADETMLGVDLLLPDITYLLNTLKQSKKKIVGMLLTHGHEDHIGALPYVLPQLPDFPVFGTPLTAAFANAKLKDFNLARKVTPVKFNEPEKSAGNFSFSFTPVTHSVPDTSNIFIKTPVGNFYHGSDFKFDDTPYDGHKTDYEKIKKTGDVGTMCLLSDCLGAEKEGFTKSEQVLAENIEAQMRSCEGKFILTTYSSNISRLNQAIQAGQRLGRKVVFVGRSLINTASIAQKLGYMKLPRGMEVGINEIKKYKDSNLLLLVAGSQAQANSALSRIVNGDHKEISISSNDVIVFSADPIPGNEVSINSLIDSIAKKGARVVYSQITDDFHVSGHGSADDLMLLMELAHPKKLIPIGGTFRQIVNYKNLAKRQGFDDRDILLLEDGQEIIFTKDQATMGRKISIKNVYVDEISGEELESFVIRDRQKISKEGVIIVVAEIDSQTGQIVDYPTIISRGLPNQENRTANKKVAKDIKDGFSTKKGRVTDWVYIRKKIGEIAEKSVFKHL